MKDQYDDLFQDAPKLSNSAKNNVVSRVKNKEVRKGWNALPIFGTTVFIVACSIFLFTVINPSNSIFEFKNGNGQPSNEGTNVVNDEQDNIKEKENEIREQINKEREQINKKIQQMENEKKQAIESSNLRTKLLKDTEIIYRALEQLDYKTIASKVHPQLGVTFALYADYGNPTATGSVNGGPYLSFSREELLENNDDQIYIFGTNHATAEIIYEMTLNEYIQDFLIYHYEKLLPVREISYNEQLYQSGGIINTIHQYYPKAKYVEYYRYESDESINDPISTQSLRFVYQDYEGKWYLTAIVRDVYSP